MASSDDWAKDLLGRHSKKKPIDLEKLDRYTVDATRWDRQDFDKLLKQQPSVAGARQKLADNIAGEAGYDEAADVINMLNKVTPKLLDPTEIRPSRLVNRAVNGQVSELPQLAKLRRFTRGDLIASAMAFEQMEPTIETLYDRLQDEMKKQQEYLDALKQAQEAKEEEESAEDILQKWLDENEPEEEPEPEPDEDGEPEPGENGEQSEDGQPEESEEGEPEDGDGSDQGEEGSGESDEEDEEDSEGEGSGDGEGEGEPSEREQLEQNVQQARANAQQAEQGAQQAMHSLQDAMGAKAADIEYEMGEALDKANDYLETIHTLSSSWGSEPGELMRLPAKRRLELARMLDDPKFIAMARLIGPMVREAFAALKKKVVAVPAEIIDVTRGDDLMHLIPSEYARFDQELTEMLFLRDFTQKNLVQYEMKGEEKLARGGIIYCHDGSSSMAGEREIWAKAVGLALLHVARKEERSFYGIQFGSQSEIRIDDFRDTKKITPEQVIAFAEYFFAGGTYFMSPLREALKILRREYEEFGAVQADIVFATDGQSYISPEFMKEFKDEQERLQFQVWGIAIGAGGVNEVQAEPLSELCDGKVATIKTLLNAKDITEVFQGL